MLDFLPAEESKLVGWFTNFVANLKGSQKALKLPDADINAVENDSNVLSHLVGGAAQAKASGADAAAVQGLADYKDLLKYGPGEKLKSLFPEIFTPLATLVAPGIVPRTRALLQRLMGNAAWTPAMAESLGISAPAGSDPSEILPGSDNRLVTWLQNFHAGLTKQGSALGVSDAEVQGVRNDHDVLAHLVTGVDKALNDTKATEGFPELVAYKDLIKDGASEKLTGAFPALFGSALAMGAAPGILPRLGAFIEKLKGLSGFTNTLGEKLGILLPVAGAAVLPTMAAAVPTPKREAERVAAAPVPVVPEPTGTNRWMAPALIGLLGMIILGYLAWPKGGGPTAADMAAPLAGIPDRRTMPANAPADTLLLHEQGATEWLSPAVDEFNKTQAGKGKIVLQSLGSREGRDHILYDKDKIHPTLWMPADMYWVDKLKQDVADPKIPAKSGATVEEGTPLLRTNVVLLMKAEKAAAFEAAMQKPEYKGHTWKLLAALATNGWSSVGASADWGKLKLAQSNPTLSNSGMAALALMFAEWAKDNPGKDYNQKGFMALMQTIESSVDTFSDTTSDTLRAFLDGSGKYDIAIVYESDVIRALEKGEAGLKVVYPTPTADIVLPVAVVTGTWVSPEQAALGKAFLAYIQKDAVQEKALQVGYRPVSTGLKTQLEAAYTVAARKDMGMVAAPDTAGSETDTKVKEGLIYNWNVWYKKMKAP